MSLKKTFIIREADEYDDAFHRAINSDLVDKLMDELYNALKKAKRCPGCWYDDDARTSPLDVHDRNCPWPENRPDEDDVDEAVTAGSQGYAGPAPIDPRKSDLTGGMKVALTREQWNLVVDALGSVAESQHFDKNETYEIVNSIWTQLKPQRK